MQRYQVSLVARVRVGAIVRVLFAANALGTIVLFMRITSAANLTWDVTGGDATAITDGPGTWDVTAGNIIWNDGTTPNIVWPNVNTNIAVFGGGTSGVAGTVTVSGTRITQGLTFNTPFSGNYTLTGGTINISSAAPAIVVNADASVNSIISLSGPLTFSGTNTITLGGTSTFTANALLTGNAKVKLTTNGALGSAVAGTRVEIGITSLSAATDSQLQLTNNITVNKGASVLQLYGRASAASTPHVVNVSGNNSYSFTGNFILQSGSTSAGLNYIFESQAGKMTISTGTVTRGNAGTRNIVLQGGGDGEWLSAINNPASDSTTNMVKRGDGVWTLFGLNGYLGTTTVQAGSLVVANNAPNGGTGITGALGNSTTDVVLGVAGGNSDASLLIDGAFTIGRVIRIPTTNTSDTGTRVLTLGGTANANSEFSGNIILGTNNQAGRSVNLTAANGGQVTFSGVIQNPTGMDATTYTVANDNWITAYPSAAGHVATFGTDAAGGTVLVDGDKTIGKLVLNNGTSNYTIGNTAGGETINFDNTSGTGNAAVTNTLGTHTINSIVKTTAASDLDITVTAGALTLAGGVNNTASKTVTVTNDGTLNLNAASAVSNVSGTGTLTVAQNVAVTANRVRQGTLTLNGSSGNTTGKLTINQSGGTPAAVGDPAMVSQVATLNIINNNVGITAAAPVLPYTGSQQTYYATLDLRNNDLVVTGGNLALITDEIRSGAIGTGTVAAPAWNGTGITSSYITSISGTALGVMRNVMDPTAVLSGGNPVRYSTFDSVTGLTGNEILVKHTWYGDLDLDGAISSFDFALLDAGFAGTKQVDSSYGWFFGDLNYDGIVDSGDYSLFNSGYIGYTTYNGGGVALPEPSTLALGLLGLGGLLAAYRRRQSLVSNFDN